MKIIPMNQDVRRFLAAICLLLVMPFLFTGCGKSKGATTQPAETSVAQAPPAEEFIEAGEAPGRVHYVQAHDTLWSLAERYYGHGKHWRKILAANRNRLSDSTELPVGMKLIIP